MLIPCNLPFVVHSIDKDGNPHIRRVVAWAGSEDGLRPMVSVETSYWVHLADGVGDEEVIAISMDSEGAPRASQYEEALARLRQPR